jgi:hypothetical protein
MFVWMEKHVKAHIDICMIGYFISKYIDIKLENCNMNARDFYTLLNRYSVASTISSETNAGLKITVLEKVPKKLKDAMARLDIEYILTENHLKKFGLKI